PTRRSSDLHQREVRRDRVVVRGTRSDVVRERRREIVGRRAGARGRFAGVRIDAWHGPARGLGLHFGFGVAKLREIADRHELERVAGRADLLVDLVAALELLLVPFAEGAFVREDRKSTV